MKGKKVAAKGPAGSKHGSKRGRANLTVADALLYAEALTAYGDGCWDLDTDFGGALLELDDDEEIVQVQMTVTRGEALRGPD